MFLGLIVKSGIDLRSIKHLVGIKYGAISVSRDALFAFHV